MKNLPFGEHNTKLSSHEDRKLVMFAGTGKDRVFSLPLSDTALPSAIVERLTRLIDDLVAINVEMIRSNSGGAASASDSSV